MLRIKTKLAPSSIHGLGVFTEEYVEAGTVLWVWDEGIDQKIPIELVDKLPQNCKNFFKHYSWVENGKCMLCSDNERYINHSDDPNCTSIKGQNFTIAKRNIQIGEEITQNYKTFDDNFGLREFGYDWMEQPSEKVDEICKQIEEIDRKGEYYRMHSHILETANDELARANEIMKDALINIWECFEIRSEIYHNNWVGLQALANKARICLEEIGYGWEKAPCGALSPDKAPGS